MNNREHRKKERRIRRTEGEKTHIFSVEFSHRNQQSKKKKLNGKFKCKNEEEKLPKKKLRAKFLSYFDVPPRRVVKRRTRKQATKEREGQNKIGERRKKKKEQKQAKKKQYYLCRLVILWGRVREIGAPNKILSEVGDLQHDL